MSLLITSLCVAGGVLIGRWAAARKAAIAPATHGEGDATSAEAATTRASQASTPDSMPRVPAGGHDRESDARDRRATRDPARSKTADHDWTEFPCALGDVVSRLGTDERWLAGVIVFSEDRPAAALFIAPEAGGDRAIFARPKPNDNLLWLEPVSRDAIVVGAEPPTSLELQGLRYERIRRLPLRAERAGAGAPDVGDTVILAEYTSSGDERLILVIASGGEGGGEGGGAGGGVGGNARAWHGPSIGPGMYDVMPSGKSTLDDDA